MKRLLLNPYKANILASTEEPVNITIEHFWKFYLSVLKVKGLDITNADVEFYTKTIMFDGLDKDFSKMHNYTPQYVHMMRKRLLDAGLLIKQERGNYSLHPSIENMKKLTKTDKVDILQFTFPFQLLRNEN